MTIAIITVSDRASAGEYRDLAGAEIGKILRTRFPDAVITRFQAPDRKRKIRAAFRRAVRHGFHRAGGLDFILTTGGTGISPRDVTPEVSRRFCRRELPGIAEVLRAESYRETPNAMLSRGFAGIRGKTVVVNFPGSVRAVKLCTAVVAEVMEHAMSMAKGEGH